MSSLTSHVAAVFGAIRVCRCHRSEISGPAHARWQSARPVLTICCVVNIGSALLALITITAVSSKSGDRTGYIVWFALSTSMACGLAVMIHVLRLRQRLAATRDLARNDLERNSIALQDRTPRQPRTTRSWLRAPRTGNSDFHTEPWRRSTAATLGASQQYRMSRSGFTATRAPSPIRTSSIPVPTSAHIGPEGRYQDPSMAGAKRHTPHPTVLHRAKGPTPHILDYPSPLLSHSTTATRNSRQLEDVVGGSDTAIISSTQCTGPEATANSSVSFHSDRNESSNHVPTRPDVSFQKHASRTNPELRAYLSDPSAPSRPLSAGSAIHSMTASIYSTSPQPTRINGPSRSRRSRSSSSDSRSSNNSSADAEITKPDPGRKAQRASYQSLRSVGPAKCIQLSSQRTEIIDGQSAEGHRGPLKPRPERKNLSLRSVGGASDGDNASEAEKEASNARLAGRQMEFERLHAMEQRRNRTQARSDEIESTPLKGQSKGTGKGKGKARIRVFRDHEGQLDASCEINLRGGGLLGSEAVMGRSSGVGLGIDLGGRGRISESREENMNRVPVAFGRGAREDEKGEAEAAFGDVLPYEGT